MLQNFHFPEGLKLDIVMYRRTVEGCYLKALKQMPSGDVKSVRLPGVKDWPRNYTFTFSTSHIVADFFMKVGVLFEVASKKEYEASVKKFKKQELKQAAKKSTGFPIYQEEIEVI